MEKLDGQIEERNANSNNNAKEKKVSYVRELKGGEIFNVEERGADSKHIREDLVYVGCRKDRYGNGKDEHRGKSLVYFLKREEKTRERSACCNGKACACSSRHDVSAPSVILT